MTPLICCVHQLQNNWLTWGKDEMQKPFYCCLMEKSSMVVPEWASVCTHNVTPSTLLHTLSYLILQKQCWGNLNGIHTMWTELWLLTLKLACFLEKSVTVHTYNLSYLAGWGCKDNFNSFIPGVQGHPGHTVMRPCYQTNKTFSGYGL